MGLDTVLRARADTTSSYYDDLNGKTPTEIHQLLGTPYATSIDTVQGVDSVDEFYKRRPYDVMIVGYTAQGNVLKVGKTCRGP